VISIKGEVAPEKNEENYDSMMQRCQWLCGEWQWQDGSGSVGKRISRRFEWWWLEHVSVSIDQVIVAVAKCV
jgi:hypothetical protein